MAKPRPVFICEACEHREPKWLGRCPSCGAWSSLVETTPVSQETAQAQARIGLRSVERAEPVPLSKVTTEQTERTSTGIGELDRVLGGGLVPGALVLVGGDPGIGKSTLLLQACGHHAEHRGTVLYVTAEESLQQVKIRANRLGIRSDRLLLLAETRLEAVDKFIRDINPELLVLDSVQTVGLEALQSPVGSVSQIRGVTHHLMDIAKGRGVTTFVVGHVTKEGSIAGPKVMEHMVDTVLYFEGERHGPFRLLRAHKNRFGSAQEIGVFEMGGEGLMPVQNPSALFLSERAHGAGSTVVSTMEGSRPILLEVQALTNASVFGNPRRTTLGIEPQRVSMLCAVLERHAGRTLGDHDVYVNVAGGLRIQEPAADLGVMAALASAASGRAVGREWILIGEVGLSGEIRAVSQLEARLQEAKSLGFEHALVPAASERRMKKRPSGMSLHGVANVREALDRLGLN